MKITCLVNNFSKKENLIDEHGLSFYIEKDNIKILFDTGMGKALFHNAKILDIDLKDINYVVLSHGHNDHTGGLNEFLKINTKAKVIAHKEIFAEKCSKRTGEMRFIGLSKEGLDLERFIFMEDIYKLSENISFYGNLGDYEDAREKNHFVKSEKDYLPDMSKDEIYLVITEKDYDILVSGCSHRGIINIIKELKNRESLWESFFLFGGLHFRSKTCEELIKLNKELNNLGIRRAFVNHCTFDYSDISKELYTMEYFFAGEKIELGESK
ncbi:MAG: MBL fold metallo-hydrolase [Fusobacteriaceae bacterium]|nr:MBL fold metallo-hydrolase [Fusobacteriaceae bacterium]